ncbi:YbgF trimerization domain-containing protein [Sphingopyxis granuli]|uniref:YbgF trimerization domain-containing protein n=1 Tax=Sphingopyxis granuli TaxID=267128 RepID=UPI003B84B0F1
MKMRHISFLATAAIALSASVPALAQDAGIDKRVERLEKEMRAVQRSVFPGGSPAFFEGEIAPDNTPGERVKSSAPVIDLTARVDALEAQLQTLTGQTEQNAFQLRELEKKFNAYKAETDKRLAAPEASEVMGTPASLASTVKPPTTVATIAAATPAKKPSATKPAATTPDAARLALVKKVEIPATGNEVEDSYNYGYRLWEAKLYPEAEAQLKQVVTKWPNHRLASYAQNLLGRAYLDEGKPSLAAVAFYNNYKDRPSGARAPHSLMYMGVALEKLGRKADACKAFRELDEVYGDKAPKDVRDDAAAAKTKTGC